MRARRLSLQGWFVWAVWATLLIALLVNIWRYGRDIPLAEDWLLVAPYTGNETDLPGWVWSQNNEHRLPLQKLIMLGLLHLSGGDFRAGMYASTLLMAAASAALILTAAAVRGGSARWTDAFFPVLLLNLGHWENYVWGWQMQFTVSIALMLCLLIAIVRSRTADRAKWLAVGGIALALLPLSGANGLIVTLAAAPWALLAGFHSPGDRTSPVLGIGALAGLVLAGLYFVGYDRPDWTPANPGFEQSVKAMTKIAAIGLAPVVWVKGGAFAFVALALLTLLISALPILRAAARAWFGSDSKERERALGMLCFGAGMLGMIAGIGYGRAGYGPGAVELRYALLVAPVFCLAYFGWQLYGARVGPWGQAALAAAAALCLPWNIAASHYWRDWYVNGMQAVERDIAAGKPADRIAADHHAFLLHWNEPLLADRIRMLEEAETGPFHTLRNRREDAPGAAR